MTIFITVLISLECFLFRNIISKAFKNMETYVKRCNICLALKTNFSMNFVIQLLILANQKGNSYNSILIIVYLLPKMIYHKPTRLWTTIVLHLDIMLKFQICIAKVKKKFLKIVIKEGIDFVQLKKIIEKDYNKKKTSYQTIKKCLYTSSRLQLLKAELRL